MRAKILGKGIVGMPTAEKVTISSMTVNMVIEGKKVTEEIVEPLKNLACNAHHMNLKTTSGRMVVLRPETKQEVVSVCENFGAPDTKLQALLANY